LNLPTCLESVAGWCGQIVVVDSGSRDRTVEIARRHADLVVHHMYVDHSQQWKWALEELPLTYEWVLPLDADHVVSPELRDQLMASAVSGDCAAYYARHRYSFKGRRIRGFKASTLRLFRRSAVHVDASEMVEWRFVVDGRVGHLSGVIYESNRKEDEIDYWIDKHQRFASRVAAEEVLRVANLLSRTLKPAFWGTPDQRMVWLKERWLRMPLFARPCAYFIYRYFFRLGCLDGATGTVYHVMHAFWFRLVIDIKISELRAALDKGRLTPADLLDEAGLPISVKAD
jgi:glycosyltransferase involved in cell wall biosynthesis